MFLMGFDCIEPNKPFDTPIDVVDFVYDLKVLARQ